MSAQTSIDFLISSDMSEPEVRVWQALRHHEGEGRAIKAEDLAALVGINVRNVQRAIHTLIHKRGRAIGSSMQEPFGYYIAVSPAERDRASKLHRSRALAMLATAARIAGVTKAEYARRHQEELFA